MAEAWRLGSAIYHEGVCKNLPYEDGAFDLVVSYLSLTDIADSRAAITEIARVVRPVELILTGNLKSWVAAAQTEGLGIQHNAQRHGTVTIVDYLEAYPVTVEWAGIRIANRYRPLAQYMQEALQAGPQLMDSQKPLADAGWYRSASYNHTPYLCMQLWQKQLLGF